MTAKVPGLEYDKEALAALCRRWNIRELRLFGSWARGEAREDSDVDLMASFYEGKKPTLWGFATLKDDLETLFAKPVDLITDKPIENPFRRKSIARDLTVIYVS